MTDTAKRRARIEQGDVALHQKRTIRDLAYLAEHYPQFGHNYGVEKERAITAALKDCSAGRESRARSA